MEREKKKNSSITIRIECKTKKELKKLAYKKGITMSELVNYCLTEIVERENIKNKELEELKKRPFSIDEKLLKLKNKMKW